jgi:predicted N-formylglutamate amidohydrolase
MDGQDRPWQIGIAWNRDARLAGPLIAALRAEGTVCVGDNLPYALDLGLDFSVPEHAMARGLPHVQVEFRNDLIGDDDAARQWADRFVGALTGSRAGDGCRAQIYHLGPNDPVRGYDGGDGERHGTS